MKTKPKFNFNGKIYWTAIIVLSFIIGLSINFVIAVWQNPTGAPPDGNEAAFLNIGPSTQYKGDGMNLIGDLTINGLFTTKNDAYLAALAGNVGIGTINPAEKLTLEGGDFLQTAGSIRHSGSIFCPMSSLPCRLYGARGLYVSGKYAYITTPNAPGMEILDISNPVNPQHVSSISIYGAFNIYVSGQYAYVSIEYTDNGLSIVDISNPSSPQIVGSIFESNCGPEPNSCALHGRSIYVSGKYAYITSGTPDDSDDGLAIVDISDPAHPQHVGSIFDDGNGGSVALSGAYGVYVSDQYAYVTANQDGGLAIIDISDPAHPQHVGSIFDDDTPGWTLIRANSVYVSEKYAYVAVGGWGGNNQGGLTVIDISDPTSPRYVSSIKQGNCGANPCALNGAKDIVVSGHYAYLSSSFTGATPSNDGGLAIIDISDPNRPRHVKSILDSTCLPDASICALAAAKAVKVSGKYAYLTSYADDGFEVLDISGIDAPTASIVNISASQIGVTENMDIGNNLYVRNGLNVGPGGVKADGVIAGGGLEALNNLKANPISTAPEACNAAMKGAMYYSQTLHIPCFCNGANWVKFISGNPSCQ